MSPMSSQTRPTMRIVPLAVAAALALLLAGPAHADTKAEKEAVAIAAQAKNAHAAGHYSDAARLFMDAYARVPEPTLVYNAARSYQKAGKLQESLPLFRLYLSIAAAKDDAGRAEARRHIAGIEAALRARKAREAAERAALERKAREAGKPPPQPVPKPKPAPVVTPPMAAPNTPTGRKVVHRPDLFQRLSKPSQWSPRQRTGAIIAGTGGAFVLIGLIIHAVDTDLDDIDARAEADHVKSGGNTFYPNITQREVDDALSSHNTGAVTANLMIVGGLVAGGVGTWMLLSDDKRVSLAPAPRRDGGMLIVSGRF